MTPGSQIHQESRIKFKYEEVMGKGSGSEWVSKMEHKGDAGHHPVAIFPMVHPALSFPYGKIPFERNWMLSG